MNSQLGMECIEELANQELMNSQGRLPSFHRQSLVSGGMASVLDACDYRPVELSMLPMGCESPSATYATLTPLQPLNDKFHHHQRLAPGNVIGSFAFMRDDRGLSPLNSFYNPYHKELPVGPSLPAMPGQNLPLHGGQTALAPYGHCSGHLATDKMLSPGSFEGPPPMFVRGEAHLPPPSLNGLRPALHRDPPLPCGRPQPSLAALATPPAPAPPHGQLEEINTKEVAQRIMTELKRYSIPQAIFAQRVLCRSQGTLSDLLRNPKPWAKLKSGRETFRRMWKWLQEPEFQRMSSLRLEACRRKEHEQSRNDRHHLPKKHRLVFTDVQRRTLLAIFKESPRPNKELQVTIARQLGLELSTVGNFFMNARRRSLDKWLEEGGPCSTGSTVSTSSLASACANS
uniref:hepatocyte nuclear factor 6-like n=1 Tax=Pristiophorus japonicus TaxID=55135 RepID=UPI00398EE973